MQPAEEPAAQPAEEPAAQPAEEPAAEPAMQPAPGQFELPPEPPAPGVPPSLAQFTSPQPPPPMDPWGDGQPFDTALGSYLVSRLTDGATPRTPPPTQSSVDLAPGCPVLQDWPESVEVDAPDTCKSLPGGAWTAPGGVLGLGEPILAWQRTCWLQAPAVTYTMPSGDLFGTSETVSVLIGSTEVLYDCRGNPKYSIQEKVYHEVGEADHELCEKYRSCDGVVWLQYFIYDYADGRTVAKTPYLHLFQDSFDIQDLSGTVIAKVSRRGEWSPTHGECGESRKWVIDYPTREDVGAFSNPTDQWPIAEVVTIISVRDLHRRPSGLVAPSGCEIRGYVVELVIAFLLAGCLCSGFILFFRMGLHPLRDYLFDLEDRVCPGGMRVPEKYEQ